MSANQGLFKNKIFLITLSFLLVIILAAGIFGMEYSSVVSENNSKNSQINALESELNDLSSKNAENELKISNQQKERDELNSKIKQLEDEVSRIKLLKAQKSSSAKPSTSKTPSGTSNNNSSTSGPKVCYLTFDDGPSDNTLKILDILKKANAKATFFVVGTSKLEYIKRIHAEGHTVALHANNHDYSKIYKSEQAYFDDLTKLSNKVKNLIGIESKIIRFPGGSSNAVSRKYNKGIMTRLTKQVQQKGYVYVDWNVDSTDASGNNISKARILSSVKNNCKGKSNICILMHDTAAKKTTVDALPEMISYLKAQGYRFDALTTSSPIFHHGLNN